MRGFLHVVVNFTLPGHFPRYKWGWERDQGAGGVGGRPGSKEEKLRGPLFIKSSGVNRETETESVKLGFEGRITAGTGAEMETESERQIQGAGDL